MFVGSLVVCCCLSGAAVVSAMTRQRRVEPFSLAVIGRGGSSSWNNNNNENTPSSRPSSEAFGGGGEMEDEAWAATDEDDDEDDEEDDDDDDEDAEARRAARRWTKRAFNLAQRGRLDQAAVAFEKAVRATPEDAPYRAALLIQAGSFLAFSGKPKEALVPLREALNLAPDDSRALHALGNALHQCDASRDALEVYTQALVKSPEKDFPPNAPLLNNVATILLSFGERDVARLSLERSLDIEPNAPGTLFNLAMAVYTDAQDGAVRRAYGDLGDRGTLDDQDEDDERFSRGADGEDVYDDDKYRPKRIHEEDLAIDLDEEDTQLRRRKLNLARPLGGPDDVVLPEKDDKANAGTGERGGGASSRRQQRSSPAAQEDDASTTTTAGTANRRFSSPPTATDRASASSSEQQRGFSSSSSSSGKSSDPRKRQWKPQRRAGAVAERRLITHNETAFKFTVETRVLSASRGTVRADPSAQREMRYVIDLLDKAEPHAPSGSPLRERILALRGVAAARVPGREKDAVRDLEDVLRHGTEHARDKSSRATALLELADVVDTVDRKLTVLKQSVSLLEDNNKGGDSSSSSSSNTKNNDNNKRNNGKNALSSSSSSSSASSQQQTPFQSMTTPRAPQQYASSSSKGSAPEKKKHASPQQASSSSSRNFLLGGKYRTRPNPDDDGGGLDPQQGDVLGNATSGSIIFRKRTRHDSIVALRATARAELAAAHCVKDDLDLAFDSYFLAAQDGLRGSASLFESPAAEKLKKHNAKKFDDLLAKVAHNDALACINALANALTADGDAEANSKSSPQR